MSLRVLNTDDNEVHGYAIGKTLESLGFEVIQAKTGLEAVVSALQQKPDIVLMDVNLPDMLGYEACSRIKKNPETAHIPVIFHTATSASTMARTLSEQAGASAFLTYPVDPQTLKMVIIGIVAKSANK